MHIPSILQSSFLFPDDPSLPDLPNNLILTDDLLDLISKYFVNIHETLLVGASGSVVWEQRSKQNEKQSHMKWAQIWSDWAPLTALINAFRLDGLVSLLCD